MPADLQTIYNISPLYRAGIYGQGQTIVVVEDTNSYGSDFTTYQTTFGLNKYGGSLVTVHPNVANNCTDPGTNADDGEADIDVEIGRGHRARRHRGVGILLRDTATFGGLIAIREPGQRRHPARGHQHELWGVRGGQWRNRQRGLQQRLSNGRGSRCIGVRLRRRRRRRLLLRQRHQSPPRHWRQRLDVHPL